MPQAVRTNPHLRGDASTDAVGRHHVACPHSAFLTIRLAFQAQLHVVGRFGKHFASAVEADLHTQRLGAP